MIGFDIQILKTVFQRHDIGLERLEERLLLLDPVIGREVLLLLYDVGDGFLHPIGLYGSRLGSLNGSFFPIDRVHGVLDLGL